MERKDTLELFACFLPTHVDPLLGIPGRAREEIAEGGVFLPVSAFHYQTFSPQPCSGHKQETNHLLCFALSFHILPISLPFSLSFQHVPREL